MYYAALETGGTKMVCAIGDENKNIIDKVTIPTDTADVSVPKMIEYFRRYPVASLGIGTFGPVCVDRKSSDYGKILKSPKKSWEGFNFYQTFSDALRCSVVVDTGCAWRISAWQSAGAIFLPVYHGWHRRWWRVPDGWKAVAWYGASGDGTYIATAKAG